MRCHSSLTDDDGVEWEFTYTENILVPMVDALGQPVLDADGEWKTTSTITQFTYRRVGSPTWLSLPSWADVKEEWKTTLCFFDEDEDGSVTFWSVSA